MVDRESPEIKGQMFDFMTPEEFDVLYDFHINAVLVGDYADFPNGFYEKEPEIDQDPEYDEYYPQFIIRLPEIQDKEKLAISFLRQLEFIRREIRDGRPFLSEADDNSMLFAQIEVDLAANRFYGMYADIVNQALGEVAEPDLQDDEDDDYPEDPSQ